MRLIALILALITSACASAPARDEQAAQQDSSVVVMVSFDGFRHDYLDRGLTPNFARLAASGVRADALIPIFPSKTFPNHHAIATGMYAEHHGMVGNEFWDPVMGSFGNERRDDPDPGRWFGGEPIWLTAERQGVRAGAFFWVATDMAVHGKRPSFSAKFTRAIPFEARVDSVVKWLSLPASERPRLVLMYFELLDDVGHANGPLAARTDTAILRADQLVGRLMQGIAASPVAQRTHLIVVSDHGMADTYPDRLVPLDAIADLTAARVVVSGTYSTLYFGADTASRNAVANSFRQSLQHARFWVRDSIPDRFHWRDNPRIPDILVLADEGWSVGTAWQLRSVKRGGSHGYDPAVDAMRGIFVAAGPQIRTGVRIPAFENIHIHPFVAALLGIQPAPGIDGSPDVLSGALR